MSAPIPTEVATRAIGREQPSQSPTLLVISGQARGNRATVSGLLRIGKAPDNDLVLPDASVSRYHCEIEPGAQGMIVRDLGSTNHTRIGRSKIQTATLEPGATLTVGDVELQLQAEVNRVQVLPSQASQFGHAVGPSLAMRQVFGLLERIAPSDATVLLEGETGTGKDVLGRSIHEHSARKGEPFVVVDCGAVSYNLIESEFFGHEKGSFTGATERREGRFELANGGTLLLDEISEITPRLQAKLLRVLQEQEFERVGGTKTIKVDVRVLATTNRDLKKAVAQGDFREDLYYRLHVFPLHVPPLRERVNDIPRLANHFLQRLARRHGLEIPGFSQAAMDRMLQHPWPGNVRELQNMVERAVIMTESGTPVQSSALALPVPGAAVLAAGPLEDLAVEGPSFAAPAPAPFIEPRPTALRPLEEVEKEHILRVLEAMKGNRTQAAGVLQISIRTLRNKLNEYRIGGGESAEAVVEGEA